jgi:hypothetical protein
VYKYETQKKGWLCQPFFLVEFQVFQDLGDKTATHFLIGMGGDMSQFENHGKVIAMAELDYPVD